MEFDEDIQQDLYDNNIQALAFIAQDLRNVIGHVAPRNLIAALTRKQKAEADDQ